MLIFCFWLRIKYIQCSLAMVMAYTPWRLLSQQATNNSDDGQLVNDHDEWLVATDNWWKWQVVTLEADSGDKQLMLMAKMRNYDGWWQM